MEDKQASWPAAPAHSQWTQPAWASGNHSWNMFNRTVAWSRVFIYAHTHIDPSRVPLGGNAKDGLDKYSGIRKTSVQDKPKSSQRWRRKGGTEAEPIKRGDLLDVVDKRDGDQHDPKASGLGDGRDDNLALFSHMWRWLEQGTGLGNGGGERATVKKMTLLYDECDTSTENLSSPPTSRTSSGKPSHSQDSSVPKGNMTIVMTMAFFLKCSFSPWYRFPKKMVWEYVTHYK